MKLFLILLLANCSFVFANEDYQMKKAVGNWKTIEGVFAYSDVSITKSEDGKSLLLNHCETWELEMNGVCKKALEYSGIGTYQNSNGSIQITEGPHSPTPSYTIEIDKADQNRLRRSWGNKTIDYFRLN